MLYIENESNDQTFEYSIHFSLVQINLYVCVNMHWWIALHEQYYDQYWVWMGVHWMYYAPGT